MNSGTAEAARGAAFHGLESLKTTKSTKHRRVPEPSAEAFLNMAQEYHLAATRLNSLGCGAESPLYFLYTHAIELALKAFIRSHGSSTPRTHDLNSLIQKCRQQGLPAPHDLTNVIELLESENSVQGFRYFAFVSTSKPEISFLREVVDSLIVNVAETLKLRPVENHLNTVVLKMTVGKPVNK